MKVISKLTLALLLGSVAIVPATYAAKEKEAKPAANAAPKLKPTPGFIKAYGPANDALEKKKDFALAKSLLPAVKAAAVNDDDRYVAGSFAINLGAQSKDLAVQKEGIELLLASPITPAANKPVYIFQLGAIAYDAKDYPAAEGFLKQAFDGGYKPGNTAILTSNALSQQKKYGEAQTWLRKGIDATIAAGEKAQPTWYVQGAAYAIKAKDNVASTIWLKDVVRADPQPKYWHDALIVYSNGSNLDLAENLDLLRLLRLTGSMTYEQDYSLYVESADARRYPTEVKSVLDEGFAKGVISRKNITFAESYAAASGLVAEDVRTLATIEAPARASASPYQSVLAADAFLSNGNYAKAKELYELALSKGKIVDKAGADQTARVLTRLGMSKVGVGDLAGAKTEFAKIQTGNRKVIAEYWTIFVDHKMQPAAVAAPAPAPTAK